MYNNKRILGIITARGGSKGIHRKNMIPLLGKPLISYTCEAANESNLLTRCILSTNDHEIIEVARGHGTDVPFVRPEELSEDHSTSIDVVNHALDHLENVDGESFDYVMILQPTSPLRTPTDIDECIIKAIETDADSVMSMVQIEDFSTKKLKRIQTDEILHLLEHEGEQSGRRDESEPVYKRNAAIYLTKVDCIRAGNLFGIVSRPYVMPAERSIDINTPMDIDIAEFYLRKQQ